MTIYDQLATIANDKSSLGYLAHYKADLHRIDRDTLNNARAGSRYLWVLRDCGTELFEIAAGRESVWVTYWLDQGNRRDTPSLTYLIDVASDGATNGTVRPISYASTRKLAAVPHPQGLRIKFSFA